LFFESYKGAFGRKEAKHFLVTGEKKTILDNIGEANKGKLRFRILSKFI